MEIKIIAELTPMAKKIRILNSKPVNLNKGMAKRLLDHTLQGLDKRKSPFIDYTNLLRIEKIQDTNNIKIISNIENSKAPDEFIISVANSSKGKKSYKLENEDSIVIPNQDRKSIALVPLNRRIAIKEKLYKVFDCLKDLNKIFKPFENF